MISTKLARFIGTLSVDPSLYDTFEADPDAVLADADLSDADKQLLRGDNRESLRRELAAAITAAPGAW